MIGTCPECDKQISIGADGVEGDIVVCPSCAADLEVTSLDPVTLTLAPEVGEVAEDWGE